MSLLKKIGLALVVILVVLQAFKPEKNVSEDHSKNITNLYPVSKDVDAILVKACNDCHSNNTKYPWYACVQPLAWWINDHVIDGKKHFNLDDFASYKLSKQYDIMEEVIEQVNEGEMPLTSYRLIHNEAKLTQEERAVLSSWAQSVLDSMKATYPIDSLIKKN
jgi:uncharacterized membrane protein